ncbi:MAG: lytic murein transglycosylase [Candidatus Yanofskybacteria bacterium]|nr:lytic murein transglycosylase [Candidatus Yanofskybacteria bacterium]
MTQRVIILSVIMLLLAIFWPFSDTSADLQEEIDARNRQIEEIQRQIDEYQRQIDANSQKARTLSGEISSLNAQINKVQLEIKSLGIAIVQTGIETANTQEQIEIAQGKLNTHKIALAKYIRILYQADQENLTEVLLKHATLSNFFDNLKNLQDTQNNLRTTIVGTKDLKADLEQKEEALLSKKNDLEKLKNLEQAEKNTLDQTKNQKNKLLKDTKGQESKYQELVKKSQKDIQAIKDQIGYLIQNGISVEEAIKYGNLAAIGAGIRPAFLLAELEQESVLGGNVGKCYIIDKTSGSTRRITNGQIYTKGIHPTRDLALFLNITTELGKDPFQTPISCGSSWGGAMGPAQFIPSTWMGYREEVSRLTGHNPANPWSIEDAFVAAAAKLARDGADSKTRAGEIAASKRYYCGNSASTKSGCVNYANSVQRKAAIIEQNL